MAAHQSRGDSVKLERSITTDSNESTVCERLATYFAFAGYQQSVSQPRLLAYRRGKFLALTAKGSPVNAVIQIGESPDRKTQVQVTLEIDTTGQFVAAFERNYWREQLDDIEKAIQLGRGN
jgi:hypothetical protein